MGPNCQILEAEINKTVSYKIPQLSSNMIISGGQSLKRLRTTGIHYLSLGIAHSRSKRPVIELNYCYIVLEIGLNILEKFWNLSRVLEGSGKNSYALSLVIDFVNTSEMTN